MGPHCALNLVLANMAHNRSDTFIVDPPPTPMSIRGMVSSAGNPPPPTPPSYPPPKMKATAATLPPSKKSTKSKNAKRRATNAFLSDPTMQSTLAEVKSKQLQQSRTASAPPVAELEEVELQMLRGIFAAHDENKDGIINKSQLAEALVSLGFSPSEKLMTKFYLENAKHGKKTWKLDLQTFLAAASKHLDSADDCTADVMYLFSTFDKTSSGNVSAQVIRHLLHEAVAPTRLSRQETDEFMAYAEVAKKGLRTPVDYEELVDKLMF